MNPHPRALDYLLVSIQFLLFGLYVLADRVVNKPFARPHWVGILGGVAALVGFVVVAVAIYTLRRSLTALPTPKPNAELITVGIYTQIRHPIYTGILLAVFGYALYTASLAKLAVGGGLLLLFYLKTAYEERQLKAFFSGYAAYQQRAGRFLPRFRRGISE